MTDRLYFRQLLSGRDLAQGDQMARQMVNFVYLIGDRETGDAVLVDPAYDVDTLLDTLERRRHAAQRCPGHPLPRRSCGRRHLRQHHRRGPRLLERVSVPVHVQADEADFVKKTTGLVDTDLIVHRSGDRVDAGAVSIELIHTPGHTPGSQCFLVDDRLVAGDTLFLDGCGRTELPGGDPERSTRASPRSWPRCPTTAVLLPRAPLLDRVVGDDGPPPASTTSCSGPRRSTRSRLAMFG